MTHNIPKTMVSGRKYQKVTHNVFGMYSSGNLPIQIITITAIMVLTKCHHTSAKSAMTVGQQRRGAGASCKVADLRPTFCSC
jgi:hypothetical protein